MAGGHFAHARHAGQQVTPVAPVIVAFDPLGDLAVQVLALLIEQANDLGDHQARRFVLRVCGTC